MTKNTRANLTLIFCINRKNAELDQALDAIKRQTDKNFNLIFLFNGCGQSEKDIFNKYKFVGINKVDYVFVSENVGDAYGYNYTCRHNITTKYEYFFDSNVILMPDFVSEINKFVTQHPDADIISFFGVPNIYFKEDYLKIKTLSDDFCNRPLVFFDNKVISVEYLKNSNIDEPVFKNYPVYFYTQLIENNPNWYSLGRQICNGAPKPVYQFNVMDLFEQCTEMVKLLDRKYYKEHRSEVEYLCIVALFRNFTYAFFRKNAGNIFLQKRMLNKIEEFINTNFPNWEKNEWLYSKQNKNDETYLKYLREFKPKLMHVLRALKNKLEVQGYGKNRK